MDFQKYNKSYNYIIVAFLGYLINYFTNNLLARHLSVSRYGDLSLALQYLSMAATLVYMGLVTTSKVYLPIYLKQQQHEAIVHYKSWSSFFVVKNAILFCLVLFVLFLVFFTMVGLGVLKFSDIHLVFYMMFAAPFYAVFLVVLSYFSADHAVIVADVMSAFIRRVVVIIVLSVFLLTVSTVSNFDLVVIYTLSYGILFCLSVFFYLCYFKKIDFFHKQQSHDDGQRKDESVWRRYSFKVAVVSFIFSLFWTGPFFVLQALSLVDPMIHRHNDLGLFSACFVIVGFLWLVISNIYLGIYPKISAVKDSVEDSIVLNKEIARASMLGLLIMTLLFLALIVFGKVFLHHFGSGYVKAYPFLLLLGLNAWLYSWGGVSGAGLQELGHIKTYMKILICSALVFFIISPPLTYYYSLIGMGIAMNVAWTLKIVLCQYYLRKLTPLKGLGFI